MNYPTNQPENYSIYLHIPFCTHRCGYCDFNTYAGLEKLMPAYVDALAEEIQQAASASTDKQHVHTIFFGGGTPSLLPVESVERIISELGVGFDIQEDAEITLEANPGTLSLERLVGLRNVGINRLSFGVQSANPEQLKLLERQHDFADVITGVKWARQAGFSNLNLDWIYGLPGQTLESWKGNIKLAIGMNPEHLSLYALSIEHGTPFKEMSSRGLLMPLDPDLAADMYDWASERLEEAGYQQYEISNWAKPGFECRHNLQYWRTLPYLGLGAGAHGYAKGYRTANVLAPAAYLSRMKSGKKTTFPKTFATSTLEKIDERRSMGEMMMMGLRLTREGVSRQQFVERYGSELEDVYGAQIQKLASQGLLESVNGTGNLIRLTRRGRLLGNQVFVEFI